MKTIAIHQPNYIPWQGYFHKIAHCDTFVFLDDVPFSKGSLTNRTYYRQKKQTNKRAYLTVPLKKHPLGTLIKDLQIDHSQNWQQRQLNQIKNTYSGVPAFDKIYPIFSTWMGLSLDFIHLSEWNQFLISQLSDLIGLSPNFICSSALPVKGKASEYIIKIVQYLDGNIYLSGTGAKKYQDEEDYIKEGIQLKYSLFMEAPYQQEQGEWLNGLSIMDKLMNCETPFYQAKT